MRNQKHIHQPDGFVKLKGCVSVPYRYRSAQGTLTFYWCFVAYVPSHILCQTAERRGLGFSNSVLREDPEALPLHFVLSVTHQLLPRNAIAFSNIHGQSHMKITTWGSKCLLSAPVTVRCLSEPHRCHYSSKTSRVGDIASILNRQQGQTGCWVSVKNAPYSAPLNSGISTSYPVPGGGTGMVSLSLQNFPCLCRAGDRPHVQRDFSHAGREGQLFCGDGPVPWGWTHAVGTDPCRGDASQPASSSRAPAPSAASDETGLAFNATRKTLLRTKAWFELLTQDLPTARGAGPRRGDPGGLCPATGGGKPRCL